MRGLQAVADFQGGIGDGGGGGSGSIVANEVASGSIDGVNVAFSVAFAFAVGTLQVFLNGDLQEPGAGADYTLTGGTGFSFTLAPKPGDKVLAVYVKA